MINRLNINQLKLILILGIGDWGLGGWGESPKPQTKNTKPTKKIF
jgi:hypothetical protein